jgi:hypothetical protein
LPGELVIDPYATYILLDDQVLGNHFFQYPMFAAGILVELVGFDCFLGEWV